MQAQFLTPLLLGEKVDLDGVIGYHTRRPRMSSKRTQQTPSGETLEVALKNISFPGSKGVCLFSLFFIQLRADVHVRVSAFFD